MGVCSSKLNESDMKWLTVNNEKGCTASTKSKGKSRCRSRNAAPNQAKERDHKSSRTLSKKVCGEAPSCVETQAREQTSCVSGDTSFSPKIISPTPRTPVQIQDLSTPLGNGQIDTEDVSLDPKDEAGGVKLDFSRSATKDSPKRINSVTETSVPQCNDPTPADPEFEASISGKLSNEGDRVPPGNGGVGDDDLATLMSIARGVDSHESNHESESQEGEWLSLHNHPQREYKPMQFENSAINGSPADTPPHRDITIVYQSNVASSNITPPPRADPHYPGIGKSPFRKRINLYEMWNDAQNNAAIPRQALDRQPLAAKRDSREVDQISRYTYKSRYEHAIMGSSIDKENLRKRAVENIFDKENESFGTNVDTCSDRNALSAISIPKQTSHTILGDSSPPPRPYNPHCGEVDKYGAYPLDLAFAARN